MVRDSGDEMEVDEEEARVRSKILFQCMLLTLTKLIFCSIYTEMKTILKTFLIELELIYDEKFSSESNDEILRQIIPRLIEAMKPSNNRYHSPEYSESDEEQPDGKRHINVYNLFWRSEEQNMPADTNFSELKTPIQTMENLIMAEDAEVSAEIDEIEVIEDLEPMGMEDLEPTGMEESELTGVEESEPMGVEESQEMEDETDKWYKFVL
ncbi:hypothetical protein C1646_771384 [Rhizophagus diaphanus]|nr:hypothetical protein C1646_771384 [Rhizophagus diaphanus] [Rhizophagus sp. MUCL 43196]